MAPAARGRPPRQRARTMAQVPRSHRRRKRPPLARRPRSRRPIRTLTKFRCAAVPGSGRSRMGRSIRTIWRVPLTRPKRASASSPPCVPSRANSLTPRRCGCKCAARAKTGGKPWWTAPSAVIPPSAGIGGKTTEEFVSEERATPCSAGGERSRPGRRGLGQRRRCAGVAAVRRFSIGCVGDGLETGWCGSPVISVSAYSVAGHSARKWSRTAAGPQAARTPAQGPACCRGSPATRRSSSTEATPPG